MIYSVFFAWVFVSLVTTNPVPQVYLQYANNPPPYKTVITTPCQESQSTPYEQHVSIHNPPKIPQQLNRNLNELLTGQFFKNPCLQKLLDPNTKFYNQNGLEIRRQPNTVAPPSVINNYFIVPPELFNHEEKKFLSEPKKQKEHKRKTHVNKTKIIPNISEIKSDITSFNDSEPILNPRKEERPQKPKSKSLPKNSVDTKEVNLVKETKALVPTEKVTKKKRKQVKVSNKKQTEEKSSTTPDLNTKIAEPELNKSLVKNNGTKTKRKSRKRPNNSNTTKSENEISNLNDTNKNTTTEYVKQGQNLKTSPKTANGSHLQNIESPLDNTETNQEDAQNSKVDKEGRKTRNPKKEKEKKESKETNKYNQKYTPVPEEYMKNFFPYMYMGNNYYSNGHYPFNFEQFFQTHSGKSNRQGLNKNSKKNQITRKDSKPNVVEVKLKPKKQKNNLIENVLLEKSKNETKLDTNNITSTTNPLVEINTVDLIVEPENIKTNAEILKATNVPTRETNIKLEQKTSKEQEIEKEKETVTQEKEEINVKKLAEEKEDLKDKEVITETDHNYKELVKEKDDLSKNGYLNDNKTFEEPETDIEVEVPRKSISAKTNIEMPPLIEDLHEYMTPELGSEDIVPTIHTNGIINDYYPIFYDDPHYNDESYYLRDLEDDRLFYTTDRSFAEPLNRDRRKYDKYEDFRQSFNVKDRINFRRNYKIRERDKTKSGNQQNSFLSKHFSMKNNQEHTKEKHDTVEDSFKTPPLLENPDFLTTKIGKTSKLDAKDFEIEEPIFRGEKVFVNEIHDYKPQEPYSEFIEKMPGAQYDAKNEYSRLINFDLNNHKIKENTTPKNDRIETVFAKTRVVKYGVGKEESSSSLPLLDKNEEEVFNDGETTYVMAKSLTQPDFW